MNQKNETIYDLEILTEQLIERMSGDLGIELINDTKLLSGLNVHLRPAISRLKFNMTHNNRLTDEIFQQYHHNGVRLREQSWGVGEDYHVTLSKDERIC